MTVATTTIGFAATTVAVLGTWSVGAQPVLDEWQVAPNSGQHADWGQAGIDGASSSRPDFESSTAVAALDCAEMVQQLKEESGLTADQLGKMLGVTRRSVHNWAAGAAVAAKHQARVETLHGLVFGLAAETADDRRDLLLDSADGPSLYRQFADSTLQAPRVQYPILMIEQFG